jgi:integrase
MGRKATGTVFRYVPAKAGEKMGHYVVRCTAPDGSRPLFDLDPSPKSRQAEALALEHAGHITEQLAAGKLGAALSRSPKGRERAAFDAGEEWFETWISERRKRGFTSTPESESNYTKHITSAIGAKHVRDWTADDLRALSRDLDTKVQGDVISWKTAWNIWGTATKMCGDACSSKIDALRVRTDNPSTGVQGPDRGVTKAKQYLYPSEFQRFMACPEVPLAWRRAVALAIYMFPRASELRTLRWEDVDLEHGTVHIHRSRDRNSGEEKPTKSATARRFAIEPALLPLLRAMHDESGGVGCVIELWSENNMALGFRRMLAKAGVIRAELHTTSRTRKAIRFHDLRATGLTWMAVRGDDPLKIMQRAGHTDFKTTQLYLREAEAVREGFGEPFPTLPASVLVAPSLGAYTARRGQSSRVASRIPAQRAQVHESIVGGTGIEPATSGL